MLGSKSDVYEVDVLKATTGQATTILSTTLLANVYIGLFTNVDATRRRPGHRGHPAGPTPAPR